MHLLLRMTLLILGLLDPGICAKYIVLDRFYNIFPNYNFTPNFSNRNLRILEGIKLPVPLLTYMEEATNRVRHTDINRWESTVVIDDMVLMKYAIGHADGIDTEVLSVTKGASIVEMYIRYCNAISNNMADDYYPLDTRQIWEFVLFSCHTLQRMIGSNFIKLGFFFSTVGSYSRISVVHLPFQQGNWNENSGYELHSDHLRCAGGYDHITAD